MTEIATPRDIVSDIVSNRLSRTTASQYQGVVEAVVAALEDRDSSIVAALAERVANDAGIRNEEDFAEFIEQVGLPMPEPERDDEGEVNGPVTDGFDADRLAATLHRIDNRLDGLESIARRLGYMGRPVAD